MNLNSWSLKFRGKPVCHRALTVTHNTVEVADLNGSECIKSCKVLEDIRAGLPDCEQEVRYAVSQYFLRSESVNLTNLWTVTFRLGRLRGKELTIPLAGTIDRDPKEFHADFRRLLKLTSFIPEELDFRFEDDDTILKLNVRLSEFPSPKRTTVTEVFQVGKEPEDKLTCKSYWPYVSQLSISEAANLF